MANSSAAKIRRQARRSPPPGPQIRDTEDTLQSNQHRPADRNILPLRDVAITHFPLAPAPLPEHISTPPSRASMSRVRLLITSLGNTPPYHSTRHSAGHILLKALNTHLNFPPLTTRSKEYGGGYISASEARPDFTLWQSPSLMNVSGPSVLKAWTTFVAHSRSEDTVLGLIVLHDELEATPGALKVRRGETSARGHNGIKSVQASLQGAKLGERLVKIGIGIGRPVSRDRDDVSGFVLGQLTGAEKIKVESAAGQLVAVLEKEMQRLTTS